MTRLEAVSSTLDGFELARIDLEQRSEGDVLGSAQSGTRSHLKLLKVLRDEDLIESARDAANELIDSDPELKNAPELAVLIADLLKEERASYVDKG
jgi:ATP-dependent DNA helicase RecG